jgi:hypothetical protein
MRRSHRRLFSVRGARGRRRYRGTPLVTGGGPDSSGKVHRSCLCVVRDGEFCSDCRGGRSTLSYRTVDLVVVVIGLYSREELSVSYTPSYGASSIPIKCSLSQSFDSTSGTGSMSVLLSRLIVNRYVVGFGCL